MNRLFDEPPVFPLLPEERYCDTVCLDKNQTRVVTVTWRCGHTEEQLSASTEESQERLRKGAMFLCVGCWIKSLGEKKS